MRTTTQIDDAIVAARAWFDDQLAQTERLRPMLAITGAVIFLALLIAVIGFSNDRVRSYRAAQVELARLEQQLKDGSWVERKTQSETLRFQLYGRLWTGETAGLAEASFERWLRERIESKGGKPDTIRIQRSSVAMSSDNGKDGRLQGLQRMTAKIVLPFEPEAVLEILNTAATADKVLVIDRLLIRSGRNALIEMDISTFVVLPESVG